VLLLLPPLPPQAAAKSSPEITHVINRSLRTLPLIALCL
jgi:hypothetical protein